MAMGCQSGAKLGRLGALARRIRLSRESQDGPLVAGWDRREPVGWAVDAAAVAAESLDEADSRAVDGDSPLPT